MKLFTALLLLLSSFAIAAPPPDACGPATKFTVVTDSTAPTASANKALVYVVEDQRGHYTTAFAVDGKWVAADHGRSWFAVAIDPGAHHVCLAKHPGHLRAARSLDLAAGKSYYFLIDLNGVGLGLDTPMHLRPLDPDEARLLMTKSRHVRLENGQ